MSTDARPRIGFGRSKKEPDRPDYSEPDFGSWASKLEDYIPASKAAPARVETPVADAVVEPVAEVAAPAPVRSNLDEALDKLLSFDGAMCAAIVDSETGMTLGSAGEGLDMELAAAGASVILRARLGSINALGGNEKIDDVLISLSSQVQIIHPLPSNPNIFSYLIGDKTKSSLAMARFKASEADLLIQL